MTIDIVIPSKRKSTTTYQAPVVLHPTSANLLAKQAMERDAIIKEILSKVSYKENDTVQPYKKSEGLIHGKYFKVDRIVRSYAQFGPHEVWPEDNKPRIVHAVCVDPDIPEPKTIFCTAGWLIPLNEDQID
jgi:hypothetical protein